MTNSIPAQPSALEAHNQKLFEEVKKIKVRVDDERAQRPLIDHATYELSRLSARIAASFRTAIPELTDCPEVSFIDREKFAGDVAVKLPGLLKQLGNKVYIADYVPRLAQALQQSELLASGDAEKVECKGIYINIRLADAFLLKTVSDVFKKGVRFGETNILSGSAECSKGAARRSHPLYPDRSRAGEPL